MSADSAQLIGETIVGRYVVREVLGKGGMGVVYRADDTAENDRSVAVKILSSPEDESVADRFGREARVMARLGHENVVQIYETGNLEDGRPFIVMEHLAGESLEARQRRAPLTADIALDVVLQVCEALRAVHGLGVVHRDLKPQNIFLVESAPGAGDIARVVVLDFGISKMLGSFTVETKSSVLLGTPQYMAPEQARGDHELISPRTDIFSLGVIAYELISGEMPFDGESVYEIVYRVTEEEAPELVSVAPGCSRQLSNAVAVAMAKNPRDRFATAEQLAAALRGEVEIEPPAAPNTDDKATVVDRLVPPNEAAAVDPPDPIAPTRKRRVVIATATIVALTIAAGFGWRLATSDKVPALLAPVVSAREARELGDLGLQAEAANNPEAALDFLARAYAAGDRRLTVRIALRHRLRDAEAVVFARRFDIAVQQATISTDGSRITMTNSLGSFVFDRQGKKLDFLHGKRMLTYSPDMTYQATGKQGALTIARRDTGAQVRVFDRVESFRWRDDRSIIVTGRDSVGRPRFSLIDIESDEPRWQHRCNAYTDVRLGFSGDTRRMIACDNAAIVDISTGKVLMMLGDSVREAREGVLALDGSGSVGLVAIDGHEPELVDVDTKERLVIADAKKSVGARWSEFSPSGETLLMGTRTGLVSYRIERNPLRATREHHFANQSAFQSIAFVDDKTVAIGTTTGVIKLISAVSGGTVGRLIGHQSPVVGMVVRGDQLLTLAGTDLRAWRLQERPIEVASTRTTSSNHSVLDGDAAIVNQDESWRQIDLQTGESRDLPGKPHIAADGRTMMIDGRLIDIASGEHLATLEAENLHIGGVSNGGETITTYEPMRAFRREGRGYVLLDNPELAISRSIAASASGAVVGFVIPRGESFQDFDLAIIDAAAKKLVARREAPRGIPFTFFIDEDHVLSPVIGGLSVWNWRKDEMQIIKSSSAPFRGNDGVMLSQRGGETLLYDLRARRPIAATSACVAGPLVLAENHLAAVRCRVGTRVLLWDGDGAWILGGEHFDHARIGMVTLDRRGRRLLVGGTFGLVHMDLTPEDRPAAEVLDIVARSRKIERVEGP